MTEKLIEAMIGLKEEKAIQIAKDLLEAGEDPLKIMNACKTAMGTVGSRFEKGEFFLPELIMAGEMLKEISEYIKPKLKSGSESKEGCKVIIATVEGDIHDIGKDIVVFMLDANGFEVLDLGIDVSAQKIVDAVKDFQPTILGLSGFLTLAFDSMKTTIEAITEAGLRDNLKIMIGGGQIDEEIMHYSGADAYGSDAMEAVKIASGWSGGK